MPPDPNEPRKWKRRKTLVVDPLVQGRAVMGIVGIAAGFVLLWAGSSFWGRSPDERLTSSAAHDLASIVDAATGVTGVAAISVYVLWVMHRFLGPARVIRHALAGMVEGDFARRLTLRKDDFLKDVAAAAAVVAKRMQDDRARRAELVAALERAIERCDAAAARAVLVTATAET